MMINHTLNVTWRYELENEHSTCPRIQIWLIPLIPKKCSQAALSRSCLKLCISSGNEVSESHATRSKLNSRTLNFWWSPSGVNFSPKEFLVSVGCFEASTGRISHRAPFLLVDERKQFRKGRVHHPKQRVTQETTRPNAACAQKENIQQMQNTSRTWSHIRSDIRELYKCFNLIFCAAPTNGAVPCRKISISAAKKQVSPFWDNLTRHPPSHPKNVTTRW